ncbi:MAG: hypothetical protein KDD35_00845 [Bdellovibrionales bacterium]|nr:hypothetical protein [Bdellovibrionales bacterium]
MNGRNIPSPTFAGKTELTISLYSPDQPIFLSGECDQRVQNIELKFDKITQWSDSSGYCLEPPDLKCDQESGSFSLKIKSLFALGYWNQLDKDMTFEIHLRSDTNGGFSPISVITVRYQPGDFTKPPIGNISSSTGASSSASYKLDGRVNFGSSVTAKSSSYRIEGGTIR